MASDGVVLLSILHLLRAFLLAFFRALVSAVVTSTCKGGLKRTNLVVRGVKVVVVPKFVADVTFKRGRG